MNKQLFFLSMVTSVSFASDFCTYHPYDSECSNSLPSTEKTVIINRSYSISILSKDIVENISPSKSSEIDSDSNEASSSEEKSHEALKNNIGLDALLSEGANSYTLPYSYYLFDLLKLSLSVTYVDNKLTSSSGIGDSTLGLSYTFDSFKSIGTFSTTLTTILPTGSEEDGLGLGTLGAVASIDYRKSFSKSTHLLCSLSYIYLGESEKRAINYGNTFTGVVGVQQSIISFIALRAKVAYTDKSENTIEKASQNDSASLIDAIVGLDINVMDIFDTNVGAIIPLSQNYGSAISDVEDRTNVYYITVNKKF